MATTLVESGLIVVTQAEDYAALVESGLIVVTQAENYAAFAEAGLILAFEAEPIHKFVEAGIIIVVDAEGDTEPVLIQGEEMLRDYTLQGQELTDGPFYPEPD